MKSENLQGALALSSKGTLGIILSEGMVEAKYPGGDTGVTHTGVVLIENSIIDAEKGTIHRAPFGAPWYSTQPTVIAQLDVDKVCTNRQEDGSFNIDFGYIFDELPKHLDSYSISPIIDLSNPVEQEPEEEAPQIIMPGLGE